MPNTPRNNRGRFTRKQNAVRRTRKQTRKAAVAVAPGAVTVGSKAQVFHGTAKRTSGGLTKGDLVMNKNGRIVSRKQQEAGKKALKHLTNAGYIAKKGTFKLMKKH